MDNPSTPPLGEPASPRRPVTGVVLRWFLVAFVLLFMLGLLIVSWAPTEIAKWYRAGAAESELDQDYQQALGRLDQALAWKPDDPTMLLARSRIKLQLKDLEGALSDSERVLERHGEGNLAGLMQRMLVHQRMGNHDAALADADQIVDSIAEIAPFSENGPAALADVLNTRAYGRALANRDVEQGLEDIQRAFELIGTEDNAAFLDTRGYLFFLNGQLEEALVDMEQCVQLAEDEQSAEAMRSEDLSRNGMDGRQLKLNAQLVRHNLAVMYQHRGLVYEALGRNEEAEKDFEIAQEYGYSPEDGVW